MNKKTADQFLPSEPTQAQLDPARLIWLLIANPKWGKTRFFMSNPDALLIAFEEGHKFQRGHKIVIDEWDNRRHKAWQDEEGVNHMTFMKAIEVLESTDKFKMVIIDTADMAAKFCLDHFTTLKKVEHASDIGEYGRGWDVALNTPFRRAIMRIAKTGRGIAFITHTRNEILRFSTGEKAKKECTLPTGVRRLCESQADVIMHGELGKKLEGERLRSRILVCEGDMDTLAGNRSGAMLPSRYIVRPTGQWAQLCKFFTDPEAADKAEARCRRLMKGSSK